MPNENQGHENRKIRAQQIWIRMWKMFTDPKHPATIDEIREKIRRPDGEMYARGYIHEAFKKLRDRGLV